MKTIFTGILKPLLWSVLTLAVTQVVAQTPTEEWHRTYDGIAGQYDEIKYIRLDAQQNVVVTGRSQSGAGNTYYDVVTQKYDPDGNLLWSYAWDNPNHNFDDVPNAMEIAPNGDVIITGYSKTSSNSQSSNSNMFVLALTANGAFAWSDSIKGTGYTTTFYIGRNIGFDLEINAAGDIYVVGQATGDNTTQYDQMVVAKYNSAGVRQWLSFRDHSTAWEYTDFARGVGLDADGNAYICGVTTLANSWRDFAVWKITPDGDFEALATEPGTDNNTSENLIQIITDPQGNSYTFGVASEGDYKLIKYDSQLVEQWQYIFDTIYVSFSSTFTGADQHFAFDTDGNIILATSMSGKIGVVKFTPSGTILWVKLQSGTGLNNNEVYKVVTDAQNNIYFTGAVSMAGGSYFDMGTFKLDPDGNLLWFIPHNGPANTNDKGHSLAVATDGSVYVGGYSNGYSSSTDYFLIKYSSPLVGVSDHGTAVENQVSVFPNPSSGYVTLYFNIPVAIQEIEVFDVYGKLVHSEILSGAKSLAYKTDLSLLDSGCYIIKPTADDKTNYTSPVIIQK